MPPRLQWSPFPTNQFLLFSPASSRLPPFPFTLIAHYITTVFIRQYNKKKPVPGTGHVLFPPLSLNIFLGREGRPDGVIFGTLCLYLRAQGRLGTESIRGNHQLNQG